MRPNFLVIGAHKAGTTTLFAHLDAHPQVFVPAQKEVHFFCDLEWSRGVGWYESLFAGAGGAAAVGEASPGYSWWPVFDHVPARIASTLGPDVRLVYILRHPVERLISHYRHDVLAGAQDRPVDEIITDWRQYVSRSMYAMQIQRFLDDGFGEDQLLLLTTDDLEAAPADVVRRLYAFLGVDDSFVPPSLGAVLNRADEVRHEREVVRRFRESKAYPLALKVVPASARAALRRRFGTYTASEDLAGTTITDDTRRALVDQLRPDLLDLRRFLGDDFACWGLLDDPLAR